MNILAVDHNAVSSSGRGFYRELFNPGEIELTILVPRFWTHEYGRVEFEPEDGPLKVFPRRTLFTGKSHRVLYLSLSSALMQLKPDILYVNSEPEGYLAAQTISLRERLSSKTKVVFVSWRNIDYTGKKFPYKLAWLNSLAEKYVLARADHCVAQNQTAKEIYQEKGFEAVTVIPPGVDIQIFQRSKDKTLKEQFGLKDFVIGYIGRLVPEKGVDLLLGAMSKLDLEYELLIVGDGPEKNQLMKLARDLGLSSRVRWMGPLRHLEVPLYLSSVDALVLPSRTTEQWKEQFGRILIEAMACEVPVVGSSSGEIPNVIGEAGLVFREGEVEDLRRRLTELATDPPRREALAKEGLERVRTHFALPIVVRQYRELFERLLH